MPLTVPQKKYIVDRINEIADEKEVIVRESFSHPDELKYKIECIKKLDVPPISMKTLIRNLRDTSLWTPSWGNIPISQVLGNKVCKEVDDSYTKLAEEVSNRRDALIRQIGVKTTALKDVVMLGAEELAHSMIDDFASWHPE